MIPFGTRLFSRRAGMAPGTLFQGDEIPGEIDLCRYSASGIIEERTVSLEELPLECPHNTKNWIRVKGIHQAELLRCVCEAYGIHPLVQEDIQNIDRRPSFSAMENGLFLTAKKLFTGKDFPDIKVESVALVLTGQTVLSFHEIDGKGFPEVRTALKTSERLRSLGADYLTYRIWDDCIDSWLLVAESMERHVVELEENVLFKFRDSLSISIHETRKLMAWLRWEFQPYRDLPSWTVRNAETHFSKSTIPFLQDLVDHTSRVTDLLDLYRDLSGDLMGILMSVQSNRMNAVMKVLTVIATLFMPLSFIAGIYGMNFQWMPELAWRWGYPAVLALMALIAGGMALFFKIKKWL